MLTSKIPLWAVALCIIALGGAQLLALRKYRVEAQDAVSQSRISYRSKGHIEGCLNALMASGRTDETDSMFPVWKDWCTKSAARNK